MLRQISHKVHHVRNAFATIFTTAFQPTTNNINLVGAPHLPVSMPNAKDPEMDTDSSTEEGSEVEDLAEATIPEERSAVNKVIANIRTVLEWTRDSLTYLSPEDPNDNEKITTKVRGIFEHFKAKLKEVQEGQPTEAFQIDPTKKAEMDTLDRGTTAWDRRAPPLIKAVDDGLTFFNAKRAITLTNLPSVIDNLVEKVGTSVANALYFDSGYLEYRSQCSDLGIDPPGSYDDFGSMDREVRRESILHMIANPESRRTILSFIDKRVSTLQATGKYTSKQLDDSDWRFILQPRTYNSEFDASGYDLEALVRHVPGAFRGGFRRSEIVEMGEAFDKEAEEPEASSHPDSEEE